MKSRWLLIIALAVLLMGAMSIEDKILIPITQWFGLDSDESFAVDLSHPNDSWNIEIGNEGGKTYIQQRKGSQRILNNPPGTEIYAVKIIQVDGDSEVVIIAENNGNVDYTTGVGDGAGGAGIGVWTDIIAGAPAVAHTMFTLFKDTIIYVATNDVYTFAFSSDDLVAARTFTDSRFDYQGHFLHQDRIYGWGTADSNNCKLFWMPEFDIRFWSTTMDSNAALGTSGFVYVDKDGGDFITNVIPLGEHIMVYKSRNIYKVLVSPTSNVPVEIIRFVANTGAYGFGAAIAWNNIHFFVAEDGVYSNNGTSIQKLSDPIDYWFRDSLVHSSGRAKVFKLCVYDNKLFVTLPKKASSASSVADYRTFVYDLDMKTWTKWKMMATDPDDGVAESHWMVRYEYSPTCSSPLTGSQFLKQRILFVRDTAGGSDDDRFWLYPRESGLADDGETFEGSYTLPLSPITTMTRRKQVERVMIYGEATVAGADSAVNNYIVWRNEDGDIAESTYFNAQSSRFFHNKRVSPKVTGDLIGMRIAIRDTNRIKINAIEIVASEKGLADE